LAFVSLSPGGFAMSKSEVERFAKDLKTKPALLADIVAVAERHGYRFSADDAKALSDAQLDAVSGGGKNAAAEKLPSGAELLAAADLNKVSGGGKNPVMAQSRIVLDSKS
jgi:hypothetical protein